ncbi:MAG: biopolymer transporter ExbD [Chitinophagaceae bacterium]|nr:biopolymer transporter ExbD [Chitinophagaceae bacterium]
MDVINAPAKKYKNRKQHKLIRVDLTPMVDLGFLLITFFIFTAALQEPKIMQLIMPADSKDSTNIPLSKTIFFTLNGNDRIAYNQTGVHRLSDMPFNEMRNIIQRKQNDLVKKLFSKNDLIVVIEPMAESTYKNFIDAMDEITITDCRHYYIVSAEK